MRSCASHIRWLQIRHNVLQERGWQGKWGLSAIGFWRLFFQRELYRLKFCCMGHRVLAVDGSGCHWHSNAPALAVGHIH